MNKTVEDIMRKDCTGCGACYNKCPVKAISMEYDKDGYIVPIIDKNKCIDCSLCYKVCPTTKTTDFYDVPPAYAVWCKDDEMRLKSSSGGMFTTLAEYIIEQGGSVYGAAYTADYRAVEHIGTDTKEGLGRLRGSKYLQSNTKDTYYEAKSTLEDGRPVLYCGTPCQIAGLYAYLGKEYDKLITADFVCHGTPPTKAYQSFIDECAKGREIQSVNFRDKSKFGWTAPVNIKYTDGSETEHKWDESIWYIGFLNGFLVNECCFKCEYAQTKRIADITLGDCWQVYKYNSKYDDRKGTSLVLVNSTKGEAIFNLLRKEMKLAEPVPLDEMKKYNGQLRAPQPMNPKRRYFFNHLDSFGYEKALWYARGRRFDVGIIGWWFASNYGSALTYYSLGKILDKMDKQVIFIHVPKLDGGDWEPETLDTINFIGRYFKIANKRNVEKLKEVNNFCDSFMLGSDQMWTDLAVDLTGYTFFLDFADEQKRKIAFSTSFGQSDFNVSTNKLELSRAYLKRFDAVSVREHSGVDVCRNRFDVDATQVMDPVFLSTVEDYNLLENQAQHALPNEPYLLCYILDPTTEKEEIAREIGNKLGIKIVTIIGKKEYPKVKDMWNTGEVLSDIQMEDFLVHIKNCNYLVTDSHHGTCFGIIYHKPYVAIPNPGRGVTRFEAVANLLGLQEHLVYNVEQVNDEVIFNSPDYSSVDKIIEKEKIRALDWLKEAFDMPIHGKVVDARSEIAFLRKSYEEYKVKSGLEITELRKELNQLKDRL